MPLAMKQCERCGKMFIPGAEHLYKLQKKTFDGEKEINKTAYYCSYTCWRKDGGDNGRRYI